jgi:hypothetical protein
MIDNYDIIVVKGDTSRWSVFFTSLTGGNTFNFLGCTLYMQVRTGYYNEPLVAGFTQYIAAGFTLTSPIGYTGGISAGATGGTVNFCIGSSQSSYLTADRICKYDVKVTHPLYNDFQTILRGNIQVLPNVTQI